MAGPRQQQDKAFCKVKPLQVFSGLGCDLWYWIPNLSSSADFNDLFFYSWHRASCWVLPAFYLYESYLLLHSATITTTPPTAVGYLCITLVKADIERRRLTVYISPHFPIVKEEGSRTVRFLFITQARIARLLHCREPGEYWCVRCPWGGERSSFPVS